jgi:hypothetical protein
MMIVVVMVMMQSKFWVKYFTGFTWINYWKIPYGNI